MTNDIQGVLTSHQFAHEEEPSSVKYPAEYVVKSLSEQVRLLQELFPGLGLPNMSFLAAVETNLVTLPEGAEGWFAFPNWSLNHKICGSNYWEAQQRTLILLDKTRNSGLRNFCGDRALQYGDLKQSRESVVCKEQIARAQGNRDILIIPAQTGLRHRARSMRRARECFTPDEFGLGVYFVGIILLTHPERLSKYSDLWIDCGGDEFSPDSDGIVTSPSFYAKDDDSGVLTIVPRWTGYPAKRYGMATGFVPR